MGGSINTDFGKCYLIVLYRFNKHVNDDFFESLSEILEKYAQSPCITVGDFNLNCFNYDCDSTVSRNCEMFYNYGMSPLISKTTHIFRTSSTLIDQVWSSYFTDNTQSNVIDSSVSNHRPLVLSVPLNLINYTKVATGSEPKTFLYHNVSPKNFERFGIDFNNYFETFCNVDKKSPPTNESETQATFSDFFSL